MLYLRVGAQGRGVRELGRRRRCARRRAAPAVTIELDMVPIRSAVHIPNPWFIQDMSGIDTEANQQAA